MIDKFFLSLFSLYCCSLFTVTFILKKRAERRRRSSTRATHQVDLTETIQAIKVRVGGGGRSLVLMEQWKRNTRNSRGRLSTTLNSIAVEAVTVHGVPRVAEREIQVMSVKLSDRVASSSRGGWCGSPDAVLLLGWVVERFPKACSLAL